MLWRVGVHEVGPLFVEIVLKKKWPRSGFPNAVVPDCGSAFFLIFAPNLNLYADHTIAVLAFKLVGENAKSKCRVCLTGNLAFPSLGIDFAVHWHHTTGNSQPSGRVEYGNGKYVGAFGELLCQWCTKRWAKYRRTIPPWWLIVIVWWSAWYQSFGWQHFRASDPRTWDKREPDWYYSQLNLSNHLMV